MARITAAQITTAFIFAAGLGTRMRPLTNDKPKPMVEVYGKPLIDWRLDKLVEAGVTRAIINTHYKAEVLEAHLAKRKDIDIVISHENVLLETGGGLVNALPLIGNAPMFLINSDTIWIDYETPALIRLAECWDAIRMDELLLLQPLETAIGYHGDGDFSMADNGLLHKAEGTMPYVFSGIQIFDPARLKAYKAEPFSRSLLWKNALQPDGLLNRIYGLPHTGEWLHIDSPEGLAVAEAYLSALPEKTAINGL